MNCFFRVVFENPEFCKDIGFYRIEGLSAKLSSDEPSGKWHTQFENIRLTRAFKPESRLIAWCMAAINNHKFRAENLTIALLGEKERVLGSWSIKKAIPVGWQVEELHAQETKVLLETIELRYAYFEIANSKGKIIAPKKT